jgi:hypothetical protein
MLPKTSIEKNEPPSSLSLFPSRNENPTVNIKGTVSFPHMNKDVINCNRLRAPLLLFLANFLNCLKYSPLKGSLGLGTTKIRNHAVHGMDYTYQKITIK